MLPPDDQCAINEHGNLRDAEDIPWVYLPSCEAMVLPHVEEAPGMCIGCFTCMFKLDNGQIPTIGSFHSMGQNCTVVQKWMEWIWLQEHGNRE